MPFIEWTSDYSVHHSALDHDHQTLVRMINALHEASGTDTQTDVIRDTISALRRYVQSHFAREERIMIEAGYPDAEAHAQGHRRIEATVADIESLYACSPEEVDAARVLDFLKNWLLDHILKSDMAYTPYLKPHRALVPDSAA